jgi:hypothetical protein
MCQGCIDKLTIASEFVEKFMKLEAEQFSPARSMEQQTKETSGGRKRKAEGNDEKIRAETNGNDYDEFLKEKFQLKDVSVVLDAADASMSAWEKECSEVQLGPKDSVRRRSKRMIQSKPKLSKKEKFLSIFSSRINRTIRIRPLTDEDHKKNPKIKVKSGDSSVQLQTGSASGESTSFQPPNFDFF